MKHNALGMTTVCLALTALLVSCPSPLGNATSGTIRLSFSGAPRGSIEPALELDPTLAIKTLSIEATGAGMEKMTSPAVAYDAAGTTLTMSIPAGLDRVVTVLALNETGTVLYSQAQTVAIVAGTELRLSFNLAGVAYSVSFDANGGDGTMAPQSIAYGYSAALPPNGFTRAGYSFVGWASSATTNANYADKAAYKMGTTSATLFAVWMANTNTVAFNANNGTGTMADLIIATDATMPLVVCTFTRAGYTFEGWSLTSGGVVAYADTATYTMGTTSAILYAKWSIVTYKIEYYPNNGDGVTLDNYTIESPTITLSPLSRAGYSFDGWFGDSQLTEPAIIEIPSGSIVDITLYAKWAIITYNITYNQNGGTGTNLAMYTIESVPITLNNPIKTDYIFSGWFDNAGLTGDVILTIPAGSTGDKILWVKWIKGQYIQGDGSGGGGGGASGAYLGGTGGAGGGGDDALSGTAGNDIIFGDGSGGGKGGRGVGKDDTTGTGAGLGGGGADSINGGSGDDILFGDGFNGTMDQWNAGKGGFGGGGGGGSGGNLGTYLGAIGGLGAGSGSGYAGSVAPLLAGFGNTGGSGTTPGGASATSIALATGSGGASYGPSNGHGGGGGFGGSSGGAGASASGSGSAGVDGNADEHRYDDSTGSIHAYVLGRLATILTDYPAFGAGVDTLDGGAGSDHLFGLGGADTFVFELDDAYSGNDIDTIWDFNKNAETDKLRLLETGVAISASVRDALILAQTADVADRRIVFSGTGKQVTIVIKNLGRDLVAGDFE